MMAERGVSLSHTTILRRVEQDHRRVEQRIYPILGFQNFGNAAVTIGSIELAQKIRKGQFDTSRLRTGTGVPIAHVWEMVMAA